LEKQLNEIFLYFDFLLFTEMPLKPEDICKNNYHSLRSYPRWSSVNIFSNMLKIANKFGMQMIKD